MYGNLSGLFGISRFLFAVCLYFIYLHKYVQFVDLGLVRGLVHILVYLSFEYYFKLLFVNAFEWPSCLWVERELNWNSAGL